MESPINNRTRFAPLGLMCLFGCLFFVGASQQATKEQLLTDLPGAEGRARVDILNNLSRLTWQSMPDSAIFWSGQAMILAKNLDYMLGEAEAYRAGGVARTFKNLPVPEIKPFLDSALFLFYTLSNRKGIGDTYNNLGLMNSRAAQFDEALTAFDSALVIFRELKFYRGEAAVLNYIGIVYQDMGNFQQAIDYTLKGLDIRRKTDDYPGTMMSYLNAGHLFFQGKQYDLAIKYYKETNDFAKEHGLEPPLASSDQIGNSYLKLHLYDSARQYILRPGWPNHQLKAEYYLQAGHIDSASIYFDLSYNQFESYNDISAAYALNGKAKIAEHRGDYHKAMEFASRAIGIAKEGKIQLAEAEAADILSRLYERQGEYKKSLDFFRLSHAINDSIISGDYQNKLAYFESRSEIEKGQAEIEQLTAQKSLQENIVKQEKRFRNFILVISILSLLIAFFIIRNINDKRQKIQSQNLLIADQKKQVESSLEELKATQSHLIQREKMASLGELTAGIAHEIQNPLNFVNNFSEINTELIGELKGQRLKEKGERNEYIETELIKNIEENEQKINQHGKRADAIVKGMLQHSQKSSGTKQPTNINALVEEYYRLAYHSFISKYKLSTEIKFIYELDASLPFVNVIPQDIGRVLLNLYHNAMWACASKSRGDLESPLDLGNYIPTVKLTTKKLEDRIEIRIRDNGPGIPPNIIDKIFQPFFTTKPAGQGTGLGLSLAYDIIKSHEGTITVTSFNSVVSNQGQSDRTKVESMPVAATTTGQEKEGTDGFFDEQAGTTFIIELPIN